MEDCEEEVYETELAQLFSEEDEIRMFFSRVDEELNKVNQFYKKQECEFLERGEMLKKQLEILFDLRQLLSDRTRKIPPSSNAATSPHFLSRHPDYAGQYFLVDYTKALCVLKYFEIGFIWFQK